MLDMMSSQALIFAGFHAFQVEFFIYAIFGSWKTNRNFVQPNQARALFLQLDIYLQTSLISSNAIENTV